MVALRQPAEDVAGAVAEWKRRRDVVLSELAGLPVVRPAGGWSLLMDVGSLGLSASEVTRALLKHRVAATPMAAWGETVAPNHVRFVFGNEPVERLRLLGDRVPAAIDDLRG